MSSQTESRIRVFNVETFSVFIRECDYSFGDVCYCQKRNHLFVVCDRGIRKVRIGSTFEIGRRVTDRLIDTALQYEELFKQYYFFQYVIVFEVHPHDKCIERLFGKEAPPQWNSVSFKKLGDRFKIVNVDFGNGVQLVDFFNLHGGTKLFLKDDEECSMEEVCGYYAATRRELLLFSVTLLAEPVLLQKYESDQTVWEIWKERTSSIVSHFRPSKTWITRMRINVDSYTHKRKYVFVFGGMKSEAKYEEILKKMQSLDKIWTLCEYWVCQEPVENGCHSDPEFSPRGTKTIERLKCPWSSIEHRWKTIHRFILDSLFGVIELNLPAYVLLEIFDWLPETRHGSRFDKVNLIQNVITTVRKIRRLREENKKTKI